MTAIASETNAVRFVSTKDVIRLFVSARILFLMYRREQSCVLSVK